MDRPRSIKAISDENISLKEELRALKDKYANLKEFKRFVKPWVGKEGDITKHARIKCLKKGDEKIISICAGVYYDGRVHNFFINIDDLEKQEKKLTNIFTR